MTLPPASGLSRMSRLPHGATSLVQLAIGLVWESFALEKRLTKMRAGRIYATHTNPVGLANIFRLLRNLFPAAVRRTEFKPRGRKPPYFVFIQVLSSGGPMTPTRLFIDYWNFELQWRKRANKKNCDWTKLPQLLANSAASAAPQLGPLKLDDTRVYASVNPVREGSLRKWLDGFLNRQPGYRVAVRERISKTKPVHCRACNKEIEDCPHCQVKIERAIEKGVDSAVITDMFSLAWEGAYEVAILVSGDADLVPAVERIQEKGPKIINATWDNYGHQLAKTCWASFSIDPLIPQLTR